MRLAAKIIGWLWRRGQDLDFAATLWNLAPLKLSAIAAAPMAVVAAGWSALDSQPLYIVIIVAIGAFAAVLACVYFSLLIRERFKAHSHADKNEAAVCLQGGNIALGPGNYSAGDGIGARGGDLIIKGGDAIGTMSASTPEIVPIYHAVEYVRAKIGDANKNECFPATLAALRQAAADTKIVFRGRPEIDKEQGRTTFSNLVVAIPTDYWKASVLTAMATAEEHASGGWQHTNPETVWAWGPKGIHEKKRYADLTVDMQQVRRVWP